MEKTNKRRLWPFLAGGAFEVAAVQNFKPDIIVAGRYALYAYVPLVDSAAMQTHYIINNGRITDVFIPPRIQPEGQTSGEWVSLGTYTLHKGKGTSVTITTKDANGYVAADAILFVPVK